MKPRDILFGKDAQDKVFSGIEKTATAVMSTLGPKGQNVLIQGPNGPQFTKDGITVAKNVEFLDNFENMGAQIAREAGNKSVKAAGDGTTSTITLLNAIAQEGKRQIGLGVDPMSLRRGIEAAAKQVVSFIEKQSVPVKGFEDLRRVATISANGDSEIGKIIAETIDQVGADSTITLEEGKGPDTKVEKTRGFEFDRGMVTEHFMRDFDRQRTVYSEPIYDDNLAQMLDGRFATPAEDEIADPKAAYVWLVNGRLGSLSKDNEVFVSILNHIHSTNVPLIIIAEAFEGDSLKLLAANAHRNIMKVVAVKSPGFGQDRKDILDDLAAFTGARVRRPDLGESLFENLGIEELGTVRFAQVGIEKTILIPNDCCTLAIENRVGEIEAKLSVTTDEDLKHKLTRRRSMLTGGVASIIVGGKTDAEIREKRDLFEDALCAARSAAQSGVVPGAGTMLVRAAQSLESFSTGNRAQDIGVHVLQKALQVPFKQIILNGGGRSEVVLDTIEKHPNHLWGFDSGKEEFCDLVERGIIDPCRVVTSVVEHATSMAGLVLSTNAVIANSQEPDLVRALGAAAPQNR